MHTDKKIFITGIAGFIGFHLAKRLAKRGDVVCGCDNFNTYYDPALKRARTQELEACGVRIEAIDICDTEALQNAVKEQDTTHLVNLAAQAGVRYSLTHPETYVHSNLTGFASVLEVCRNLEGISLIFASSSSVYGLNKKVPFAEDDPTILPPNLYAATKKSGEMLAFSYHHLYHIPMRALRFFTVYGPWGRPDMAYFSFAKAIAEDKPISVFHKGQMRRDFTYIDDIISGVVAAIDYDAPFEIFNLGNHKPELVSTLIELLEKKLGKKARINYLPKRPEEVETTFANITKAKTLLQFEPKTSLDVGLDHFLEWFSSTYFSVKAK